MTSKTWYLLAADALLVTHVVFIAYVVLGLLLILTGKVFAWRWVRNPWFRLVHLVAIAIVVVQSWFGVICPLTTWEMGFRARAGDATYAGSFVSHWLSELIYYQAPAWVFAVVYTAFGVLVVLSWFWVRPHALRRGSPENRAAN